MLDALLSQAIVGFEQWAEQWGPLQRHPALEIDPLAASEALAELIDRLGGNYPFFHPRYAGQMLKPPHPIAIAGYVAAMMHNPNNHALDGGPPTSALEKELVPKLAGLLGLPENSLGHLTSSGTVANLEALFVAREIHPDKGIAFGAEAHYTHARMCHLLGVTASSLPCDDLGRIDLEALEQCCRSGGVGTVVLTAGSTGLGMVDPIEEGIRIARSYGVRVHVDAAYGGFFATLAHASDPALRALVPANDLCCIADCDSVVIDPHKHGLQPYGCGAVLFRDPGVRRFYRHDSPYTYFTSTELHLGEISLECSRAGANAAALWLTERLLPWTETGLGASLAAGLRAAAQWRQLLAESEVVVPYQSGDLDIVTFLPRSETFSTVDRWSRALFETAMQDPQDPIFLATYTITRQQLQLRHRNITGDVEQGNILRSVLMKPEHLGAIAGLHRGVESFALATR